MIEKIIELLNESNLLKQTNLEQINNSKKEREYAVEEIIDLFNTLNNKNERLSTQCRQLESENKQLKSQRSEDAKEFSALFKQNLGLKKENEKLRTQLVVCKSKKEYETY